MGRFYKTAKPNMIDFMYQVPEQAILGAIKGADAQLEKQEQYLTDFQKQLKHQALSPDKEEQKQMLKQYEDQIKQHALNISSSPLEALKQKQGIRELGNTIYEDVTRGKLFAQYSNYASRADFEKRYREEAMKKDGRVTTKQVEDALAAWDASYAAGKTDPTTGQVTPGGLNYDPATGNYRKYGTEELASYMDAFILGEDAAKGWKEDSIKTNKAYISPDGKWKIKEGDLEREASFSDIFQATSKQLNSDQKLKDYLTEQLKFNHLSGGDSRVGLTLEDVYGKRKVNEDGTSEYEYRTYVDKEGKTQYETDKYGQKIPIKGGILWDAAYKAAEKYGFKDIEKGRTDITETEQYKSDIAAAQKEKEKAAEIISFTNNQAEAKVQLLKGVTVGDIKDKLAVRETDLINELKLAAKSYGDDINRLQGVDSKVKGVIAYDVKEMLKKIEAQKDPDKASQLFDQLQGYVQGLNKTYKNIVGIENIATGVKELKNKYVSERNTIYNDTQVLGSIWNEAADKLGLTSDINSLKYNLTKQKETLAQLGKGVNLNIETKGNEEARENYYRQQAIVAKTERELRQKELAVTNQANSMMPEKNFSTVTISSTGGDYFKTMPGITPEILLGYDKALKKGAELPLMSNLLSGSKAQFIMKGKSQPLTYQKALEEGLFDSVQEDDEGNVSFVKDGNIVAKFKKEIQSFRNVLTGVPQLGINSKDYQVTLVATDRKSKDYMGFSTGELYIPFNELSNQEVKSAFKKAEPALTIEQIKQQANANNVNKKDINYHYRETHNGKTFIYYPNVRTTQGEGKWVVPTNEGVDIGYGTEGQILAVNQLSGM
jgi:hypothetical protein